MFSKTEKRDSLSCTRNMTWKQDHYATGIVRKLRHLWLHHVLLPCLRWKKEHLGRTMQYLFWRADFFLEHAAMFLCSLGNFYVSWTSYCQISSQRRKLASRRSSNRSWQFHHSALDILAKMRNWAITLAMNPSPWTKSLRWRRLWTRSQLGRFRKTWLIMSKIVGLIWFNFLFWVLYIFAFFVLVDVFMHMLCALLYAIEVLRQRCSSSNTTPL